MEDKPPESMYASVKESLHATRRYITRDCISSLYEFCFVKDVGRCPYFPTCLESFAILLKGKSLEQLPRYDKEFESCFVVNNFDEEMKLVGDSLTGKKCVHLVNRLMTAPLQKRNYKRLNITEVQLPKVSAVRDQRMKRAIEHYKFLGLNTHFLPKKLLELNRKDFGKEYAQKYPNTGILAIIYALEILRPKVLWIVGLDFYQSDYLARRPHQNPIDLQREKIKRTNLVEVTANVFRRYEDVKINMISYYKGFPTPPNVKILS